MGGCKNEAIVVDGGRTVEDKVCFMNGFGTFKIVVEAFDGFGVKGLELFEGGGELTFDAGGVEAHGGEGFEVGRVGFEAAGFVDADAAETPLTVDDLGDEVLLDGIEGIEV